MNAKRAKQKQAKKAQKNKKQAKKRAIERATTQKEIAERIFNKQNAEQIANAKHFKSQKRKTKKQVNKAKKEIYRTRLDKFDSRVQSELLPQLEIGKPLNDEQKEYLSDALDTALEDYSKYSHAKTDALNKMLENGNITLDDYEYMSTLDGDDLWSLVEQMYASDVQ